MDELRYVVKLFEDGFSEFKNKRIVLYGKGPYTDAIIRLTFGYNIVGIMDRDIKEGIIYGLPVVSESNIVEFGADLIVTVTRPESEGAVFDRINAMCSDKHIMLYGLDGANLFDKYQAVERYVPDAGDIFRQSFANDRKKRIGLYGKGIIAANILQKNPDFNIVGIMDKTLKAGVVHGKPILDYEDVLERNIDIIVTATKDEHTPYVTGRIKEFCSYNKIQLFDYKGNNLHGATSMKDSSMNEYYNISEKDLLREIDKHSVITFDIFDTLIMRKTLNPLDVFEIIEDRLKAQGICLGNFRKLRVMAQETGVSHPNLHEVYAHLQEMTGISDDARDKIMNLEIETEKMVLIRREKMISIMKKAISQGKRVFIISDMYLQHDILEDILNGLGITGYEKMYISCDYRTLKSEELFNIFLEDTGISAGDVLHIGDNESSDGRAANGKGIDSFLIKSAKQMLDMTEGRVIRSYLRSLNERSMVGLVIAKLFNNPFALYESDGRVPVNNTESLGYSLVAPLISSFLLWMIEELRDRDYDKVLFAARDGFLIEKMYRYFMKEKPDWRIPAPLYFMMSRRMIISASVKDEDDLHYSFIYSPRFDIERNFHFKAKVPYAGDPMDVTELVRYQFWLDNKEAVYAGSKKNNDNFHKYLKKKGIKGSGKYAFFDFVSLGSCQDFLERNGAFDFDAYYTCFRYEHFENRKSLKHTDWLYVNARDNNSYERYRSADHFYRDFLFLESVMTSDKPSLSHFDDEGNPVFDKEQRTKEELRYMKSMHKAIMEFFKEYIDDLWVEGIAINRVVPDMLYHFMQPEYSNISDDANCKRTAYDDLLLEKA